MKSISFLIVLTFLTGCFSDSDGGDSSIVSKKDVEEFLENSGHSVQDIEAAVSSDELVASAETEESVEEDSMDENDVTEFSSEEVLSNESLFSFNLLTGKCTDSDLVEGLNLDQFGECGDLSAQMVETVDFKKTKNYWMLNLEDATVSNSNIHFKSIAHYEVSYNENTIFDGVKYYFTKLFDQHIALVERERNKMIKNQSKVVEIKNQIEDLRMAYEDALDERSQKKVEKKIIKKLKQLEKEKKKAQLAMNKMYRHQDFSKSTYGLASGEPKIENPKVKNKKWLSLNSLEDSLQIESAKSSVSDEQFTLSLWFRTTETSNGEARVINYLYEGGKSSLIFGVDKETAFLGYRDSNQKYHRNPIKFSYSDGNWHNAVITYSNGLFNVYLDGQASFSKTDSFLGFSSLPATLGSYRQSQFLFKGDIDEITTWTEALANEDAEKIYNNGVPTQLKYHTKYSSLSRWWRMGDKISRSIAGEVIQE